MQSKILAKTGIVLSSIALTVSLFSSQVLASPSLAGTPITEEQELLMTQQEDFSSFGGVKVISLDPLEPPTEAIAVDYGTQRIVNYAYAGYGVIDTAEDTEAGILNTIKGLGMVVAGVYIGTVEGVILGVADVAASSINYTRYVTAKTYKSYRYIGKEVQVYTPRGWSKYYDARSRQIYKHYFGTYVTSDGSTRTKTEDYTNDLGYNPVKTNYSPNYNNSTELKKRAYYNYKMGGGYRYPEWFN